MDDYFQTYNIKQSTFDCGLAHIGGLPRDNSDIPKELQDNFRKNIQEATKGYPKLILTLLKSQDKYRKICEELGFDKSPEYLSKYDRENTIAFYTYGKKEQNGNV